MSEAEFAGAKRSTLATGVRSSFEDEIESLRFVCLAILLTLRLTYAPR